MPRLKDLSISFLSLVAKPATGKDLILRDQEGRATQFELVKTDDERMVAYGIVYAPDEEDSHGDRADAQTIRRAAYEFMREARLKNIDTEHSFTAEMAFVAESWLIRSADPLFPEEPEGAWAVGIQVGDPDLWRSLKSGELTGISLAGIARMEPEPGDTTPRYTEKDEKGLLQRLIKALTTTTKEQEVNKEEVRVIVREEVGAAVSDAVTEALKSAGMTEGDETPKEPRKTETPDTTPADLDDRIAGAVSKAIGDLGKSLEDKITKALAPGETETTDVSKSDKPEESFA